MEKPIKLELTFFEFNDLLNALRYYQDRWKDAEWAGAIQQLKAKIEEQGFRSIKGKA